jgi:hypothetical protein
MFKLNQLLTEREKAALRERKIIPLEELEQMDYKDLTVRQLRDIGLEIIRTEYPYVAPECIIPCKALEILTNRAMVVNALETF